jgi:hypothetical protein
MRIIHRLPGFGFGFSFVPAAGLMRGKAAAAGLLALLCLFAFKLQASMRGRDLTLF